MKITIRPTAVSDYETRIVAEKTFSMASEMKVVTLFGRPTKIVMALAPSFLQGEDENELKLLLGRAFDVVYSKRLNRVLLELDSFGLASPSYAVNLILETLLEIGGNAQVDVVTRGLKSREQMGVALKDFQREVFSRERVCYDMTSPVLRDVNLEFVSRKSNDESLSAYYEDFKRFVETEKKEKFRDVLRAFMQEKGVKKRSELTSRSGVTKETLCKIMNDSQNEAYENYTPSKNTVLALGVGLRLDEDEFEKLMKGAGYFFGDSVQEQVVKFLVFKRHIYNIDEVNSLLVALGAPMLTGACRDDRYFTDDVVFRY